MLELAAVILMASASVTDCDRATTTRDMERCEAQELERAEGKLRDLYQQILEDDLRAPESAKERKLFIEGHEAWLKYRKSHCSAVYEAFQGGTMRGIGHASCMNESAKRRIEELQGYHVKE